MALDTLRCLRNTWQRSGAQSFWATVTALSEHTTKHNYSSYFFPFLWLYTVNAVYFSRRVVVSAWPFLCSFC